MECETDTRTDEDGEVGMTDLRPCPFCGESAQIKQLPFCPEDIKSKKWIVGCDGKNGNLCPGYIWKCAPFYVTRDQAVDNWNHSKAGTWQRSEAE